MTDGTVIMITTATQLYDIGQNWLMKMGMTFRGRIQDLYPGEGVGAKYRDAAPALKKSRGGGGGAPRHISFPFFDIFIMGRGIVSAYT